MFVLLFAALKVAGQTTGYLRFDTVKIMKQNGTCELYVINSTKDSLGVLTNVGGGLTRFIKPKVLNDSTIIVGLDTLVLRGATGGSTFANNNIGTGYALVATPSGNIKRINNNYGILIDSTTTANTITIRADTSSTNHVVTQSDLNDAIAGAGGSSTFAGLSDVTVSSPKNGQVPYYDSVTSKWKNGDDVYVNVKRFRAVGDSVTDDRAAIIKARDYVYTHGGVLFFPAGKYRISDSILFQYPIRIQGVGKSGGLHNNQSGGVLEKNRLGPIQTSTEIIVTDGKNGFVFERQADETKAQYTVENLTMSSTVAPGSTTGGAFIVVRGMLQGTVIRECTFYGGYVQVNVESGYYQLITGCHFSAPRIAGIKTNNNIRFDTGDFTIQACTFNSGTFNTASDSTKAIWWQSGGGMRIVNNKFDACEFDNDHGFVYDVYCANELEETSDILISNNSFENWVVTSIYMRGIVANYVRNIHITSNQFAPVNSTGPAIDIDRFESIVISDFTMRDWFHTVSAPAIRATNCIDVTIGKGEIRDYSSKFDMTGTTNYHIDYMHSVDMAVGSKNTTNIAGLDATKYTTLTVLGRATSGQYGSGHLEVGSQVPDQDGADVGYLSGTFKTGGYRVGYIGFVTDGSTSSNRGGKIVFGTKANGSSLAERMSISQAGKVAIQIMDSVGTPTGGCVFRDAITKELRLGPCGSGGGSSQWTTTGSDIYYNTGNVFIGKTSGSGFKMDIESSATTLDGIRVTNTSNNAAARAGIRLVNDASELAQLSMISSTHATLPNFSLFEATKSLQFGVDQGVASGGSAVINFVTGGYSVSPALQIKGTGVVYVNTTTDNGSGAKLQVNGDATVTDEAYDASTWNSNNAVPTKNAIRDKIESLSTGNGIYGGSGSLPSAVTITGGNNALSLTGTQSSSSAMSIANTGNGSALSTSSTGSGSTLVVSNSSSGTGVQGTSSSGIGGNFTSTSNIGLRARTAPSSTNTVVDAMDISRASSGTPANGMGLRLNFKNTTSTGSEVASNYIESKWTTATDGSEVGDFSIWGRNSGVNYRRFTILGTGQYQMPYYGAGTFTGTLASYLVTTSGGDVVEQAASTLPLISTGTAAPATTPGKVGDIYVDTTNKKLYFATGTSSSADWTIAN